MRHFVICDAAGLILQTCFASGVPDEQLTAWAGAGQTVVFMDAPIPDMRLYRVVEGVVVERATMTPSVSQATIDADGVDESVISSLPDPCTVQLSGAVTLAPTVVTGGSATITSTVPGTITVRVTADPTHKAWETTIDAV